MKSAISGWLARDWPLALACIAVVLFTWNFFASEMAMSPMNLVAPALGVLVWGASSLSAGRNFFHRVGLLTFKLREVPEWLYVAVCATLFLGVTVYLSGALFGHIPHIADTHAQFSHSRIMATGKLYAESHMFPEFFNIQFFINDGKYYSQYPPGHIFLLTLGQWAGAPWLVNPLLGALTVIAVYLLARELGGEAAAKIAAPLVVISPFVVFMSSEYMNHATTLLTLTLACYFYVRTLNRGGGITACLFGIMAGYALITRPQTVVMFLLPIALHGLWKLIDEGRERSILTAYMLLGLLPLAGLFLAYNHVTNGSALVTGYEKLNVTETVAYPLKYLSLSGWLGIGADIRRVLAQISLLHWSLFIWPGSSLLPAFALFILRAQPRHANLLISCCLTLAAGLLLTPYNDGIFRPRYLYECSGVLMVMTALFFQRLPAILRERFNRRARRSSVWGAVLCVVMALHVCAYPNGIALLYRYYGSNYWEGNASFYNNIVEKVKKPALVFMKTNKTHSRFVYFMTAPLPESAVIFASYLGPLNKELMSYYKNRYVYVVTDETIYRVQ